MAGRYLAVAPGRRDEPERPDRALDLFYGGAAAQRPARRVGTETAAINLRHRGQSPQCRMLMRVRGGLVQYASMTSRGIVTPRQLAMLTDALDEFCRENGIRRGSPEHEEASLRVMALFERGISSAEDLARQLRALPRRFV